MFVTFNVTFNVNIEPDGY